MSTDWTAIATAVAAGATALAAVFTARMAARTRILAEATDLMARETAKVAQETQNEARAVFEQAEVTKESLYASVAPLLTTSPRDVQLTDEQGELRVALTFRNIGAGLAIIDSTRSWLIGSSPDSNPPEEHAQFVTGATSSSVIAPGASGQMLFALNFLRFNTSISKVVGEHDHGGLDPHLAVDIAYTNIRGTDPTRARFHISKRPEARSPLQQLGWSVDQIEYFRPAKSEEPFAVARLN